MTAPIGTAPIGGGGVGPAYTDSQAIAAYNAWRDSRTNGRSTPASATGVFATYVTLDTSIHGGPVAGPGPLAGGLYVFDVQLLATGTSSGSQIEVQVNVDAGALTLPGPFQQYTIADGLFGFYGRFDNWPFAPGNHTIELQFRQPGGPGSSQAIGGQVTIARVG